jgi:hypothetical protein
MVTITAGTGSGAGPTTSTPRPQSPLPPRRTKTAAITGPIDDRHVERVHGVYVDMDPFTNPGGFVSKKLFALVAGVLAIVATLALSTVASASSGDRNHDRIPDRWEKANHLSLRVNQAKRDADHDGLDNRGEFKAGLNPRDRDTDDDGIEDGQENAGTIASFTGGILTVNLAGGGTLTATVTPDTEIECDDAGAKASSDGPGGDDQGGDQGDDHGDGDHGDDDHQGDAANCGTAALTAGRKVDEGELKTSGGTAVWEKLELGA